MAAAACQSCQGSLPKNKVYKVYHKMQSPYRLMVRTSCRGRDNPGSTPRGDIWMLRNYRVPEFNVGVGWHTQPSPAAASTPERCLLSRFELLCGPNQHMTELS